MTLEEACRLRGPAIQTGWEEGSLQWRGSPSPGKDGLVAEKDRGNRLVERVEGRSLERNGVQVLDAYSSYERIFEVLGPAYCGHDADYVVGAASVRVRPWEGAVTYTLRGDDPPRDWHLECERFLGR